MRKRKESEMGHVPFSLVPFFIDSGCLFIVLFLLCLSVCVFGYTMAGTPLSLFSLLSLLLTSLLSSLPFSRSHLCLLVSLCYALLLF